MASQLGRDLTVRWGPLLFWTFAILAVVIIVMALAY
jgi:hypothetical protein